MGGVTLSYVCLHCRCFPLEDYFWWVSSGHGDGNNRKKRQCNWLCAACGRQYDWRAPNRVFVIQDGVGPREAKVFRARAAPQGMCENLINSLKLLTNQQKDGDSPVENIATGLLEKSRKGMMDGLRKFVAVDNHEAVKVGGLRQGIQSFKVVKPKFTAYFPGAVIREEPDELHTTSRRRRRMAHLSRHHQRGGPTMGPPPVDADWHASCQAIYQGQIWKRCITTVKNCAGL